MLTETGVCVKYISMRGETQYNAAV